MTEKDKNDPWRTQAPDFMVAAIDSICETRDEIRRVHAALTSRVVELNDREEVIRGRESAMISAAVDMKTFVNRIYGPDSELSKITAKLSAIEFAAGTRDDRYMQKFQDISNSQAHFNERFEAAESRAKRIEDRVMELEKIA